MASNQKSTTTVRQASILYSYRFNMVPLGLELAQLADLPSDVLIDASRIATRLTELEANRKEDSESSRIALRRKALLRVSGFLQLFLTDEHLRAALVGSSNHS